MSHGNRTYYYTWTLLVVSIAATRFCFSQSDFYFKQLSSRDGLSQNTVSAIIQDEQGFLWFGTQYGLNRYDGLRFFQYKRCSDSNRLSGTIINSMAIDKTQGIWAATNRGLSRFDPIRDSFVLCPGVFGKVRDVSRVTLDEKGNIWYSSNSDVFRISIRRNRPIQVKLGEFEKKTRFLIEYQERMFIGGEFGIYSTPINSPNDLHHEIDFPVEAAHLITADSLVVGTSDGRLILIGDTNSNPICSINSKITAICTDLDGNLWIGSRDGLFIFYKHSGKVERIISIGDNHILTIYRDQQNLIWVGTFSGGVFQHDPRRGRFQNIYGSQTQVESTAKGFFVWDIAVDTNLRAVFATKDFGILEWNGTQLKSTNSPFKEAYSVAIDGSRNLWAGTSEGLYVKGSVGFTWEKVRGFDKQVRTVDYDPLTDEIWIGSEELGLCAINSSGEVKKFDFPKDFEKPLIYTICFDRHEDSIIWIGTFLHGLLKFDKSNSEYSRFEKLDSNNRKSGKLSTIKILYIYQDIHDPRSLWIATSDRGLLKIDRAGTILDQIDEDNGLPSNKIYSVFKEDTQKLWVATSSGLSLLYKNSDRNDNYSCITYRNDDWFGGAEFNAGALGVRPRGHVYIGNNKGVVCFNPHQIIQDNQSYPIRLTGLIVNNKRKTIIPNIDSPKGGLDSSIFAKQRIELDYWDRPFIIEFSTLEYSFPNSIEYRFQLKNIKNGKILDEGTIKEGNYVDLSISFSTEGWPPDEYILNIWSRNYDGIWNHDHPKSLLIKIHPPFWMQPCFFIPMAILILICLIVIVISLIRSAKRQVTKLEKEVQKATESLVETYTRSKNLQELINQVSRIETPNELASKVVSDFTDFFRFTYARFVVLNYIERKHEIKKASYEISSEAEALLWDYDNTITFQAKNQGNRDSKIDVKVMLEGSEIHLPRRVSIPHSKYTKVLIPILRRAKHERIDEEVDHVIGMVEGIYPGDIPDSEMNLIELYTDNCAQPYFRNSRTENREIISGKINSAYEKAKGHLEFCDLFLQEVTRLIKADKADMTFLSFTSSDIELAKYVVFHNYSESEKKDAILKRESVQDTGKGIISYVAKENKLYYAGNLGDEADGIYIKEIDGVQSELSVPIRHQGIIIGVLNIYSNKKAEFDILRAKFLQYVTDRFAVQFIRKKLDYTIRELILPLNILSGLEGNIAEIIKIICRHFKTEHVSIWQKQSIKEGEGFCQIYATDSILEKCSLYGKKCIVANKKRYKTDIFHFRNKSGTNFEFWDFAEKMGFSSFIYVPLIRNEAAIGFINIYSLRAIEKIFQEDYYMIELIASILAQSMQATKLTKAFDDLSQEIHKQKYPNLLQQIVEVAREVLLADISVYYDYDTEHKRFSQTPIAAGQFKDYNRFLDSIKELNSSETTPAHIVLRKGPIWSSSTVEYINAYRLHKPPEKRFLGSKSFWKREAIKSSVGLRIEQDDSVIGILFLNYRNNQIFDELTKLFFSAFALKASNTIVSSKYFALLSTQRDQFENETKQIAKDADDRIELVQRTAFYLLARGINHDVRDRLMELATLEREIRRIIYPRFTPGQKSQFDRLFSNLSDSADHIDDLLDRFKLEERKKQWVGLRSIIEENVRIFKFREALNQKGTENGIEFIREYENDLPELYCDKSLLLMITYNIISNAVKAIEDSRVRNAGVIRISAERNRKDLLLKVEDNGIGIDFGIRDLIFEPYFSRREAGVGFGLYFVRETLEKQFEGEVYFDSVVREGTTFYVRIPIDQNQ